MEERDLSFKSRGYLKSLYNWKPVVSAQISSIRVSGPFIKPEFQKVCSTYVIFKSTLSPD